MKKLHQMLQFVESAIKITFQKPSLTEKPRLIKDVERFSQRVKFSENFECFPM